jgi:hypothetical protein
MFAPIYSAMAGLKNIDISSAALQGASTRILGDGTGSGNGIPGGVRGIQRNCGDILCMDENTGREVPAMSTMSRQAGVTSALEDILTSRSTQVPKLVSSYVPYAFLDREPDVARAAYHDDRKSRPFTDSTKNVYNQAGGGVSVGSAGPPRSYVYTTSANVNAYEDTMRNMV